MSGVHTITRLGGDTPLTHRLLLTGSHGLIGSALKPLLRAQSFELELLDLHEPGAGQGDILERGRVHAALQGCHGVIHLAAISRVLWGERDPERCWDVNVNGLRGVLSEALDSELRPWVIFASSREVYGQPDTLPVREDTPLNPVNIYGRSKHRGEVLIDEARESGLRACVVRLSNVFGTTRDHADRVVPAFARAAASGGTLRIDGAGHTFDFTHVDDVAAGIVALVSRLSQGEIPPPPIHFVSGVPTTLQELATLAVALSGTEATLRHAPPRNFDVARFFGSHDRATALLGWTPRVSLEEGLARLIHDFHTLHSI